MYRLYNLQTNGYCRFDEYNIDVLLNSLSGALDSAIVRSEFRGVGTPGALADEEFRVGQMGEPLSGAPKHVRVRDGQVSAALDGRGPGPDQQMTVARERLGAVGYAAVLQHRARVVDGHVGRIGEGHFVPVDLHDPAHPEYLFDRPLFRVQFVEPAQVVRNPYTVCLVLGPAAATGAVRFQLGQLGPDVRVVLLLVQAPDHRDRLIAGMWDREVLDFHLYSRTVYVYFDVFSAAEFPRDRRVPR